MENVANKEVDIPTDDQKDWIANLRFLPFIVKYLSIEYKKLYDRRISKISIFNIPSDINHPTAHALFFWCLYLLLVSRKNVDKMPLKK